MAAPQGYDITRNDLFNKMRALRRFYGHVATGTLTSLVLSSPPGLGKTFLARQHLAVNPKTGQDTKLVYENPTQHQIIDVLRANKERGSIIYIDDVDRLLRSANTLNVLKAATEPTQKRIIADSRPEQEQFEYEGSIVICTNIDVSQGVGKFSRALWADLKAFFSRSCVVGMTFDEPSCYHYACWLVTEGERRLTRGLNIKVSAVNEVLEWFCANYARLTSVSPRTLYRALHYRKTVPDDWRLLADAMLEPSSKRGTATVPLWTMEPGRD